MPRYNLLHMKIKITKAEVIALIKQKFKATKARPIIYWGETESLGTPTAEFDGFEIELEKEN